MRVFGVWIAAILIAATAGGLVFGANGVVIPLALVGLVAGPVAMLLMLRSALRAKRAEPKAELHTSEQRLRNLRQQLANAEAQCQALGKQIEEMEAEASTSSVVLEAERIAQASFRRMRRGT